VGSDVVKGTCENQMNAKAAGGKASGLLIFDFDGGLLCAVRTSLPHYSTFQFLKCGITFAANVSTLS
jgi:hypothetical protein